MYTPTNPHQWGTGGLPPHDWEGFDTEPFAGEVPPREVEDAGLELAALKLQPGQCTITCVTPVWAMRRRGLVVKHGDGWLTTSRCPCCGERAAVEFTQPVQDCAACDGAGHVPHAVEVEDRGPGAFRLALRQCREVLRIRPKETVSEAKDCTICSD